MRVFVIFELVIVAALLYLVVNLVRYFFFREIPGGKVFGLSDKWIERDKDKQDGKGVK